MVRDPHQLGRGALDPPERDIRMYPDRNRQLALIGMRWLGRTGSGAWTPGGNRGGTSR